MKLIDQTPFQNYKGEINLLQRLQGTLKYGLSWSSELKAQKQVLAVLDRILQGFTVIRNHTLEASGIVLPLIVIGQSGIVVAYVTHLRGTYLAKEDTWRTLRGSTFQDAPINLLTRTERMSRALNLYLERQGAKRALNVEPVILAADPGLFVDTQRPIVRVVLNDGLERWANSLAKAPPVISVMNVEELAERILTPKRPRRKPAAEADQPLAEGSSPPAPESVRQPEPLAFDEDLEPSRAQAIFRAAEQAEAFDPQELGFAFEGTEPDLLVSRDPSETSPEMPLPAGGARAGLFGMSRRQTMLLAGMLILELCILIGFAAMFFLYF